MLKPPLTGVALLALCLAPVAPAAAQQGGGATTGVDSAGMAATPALERSYRSYTELAEGRTGGDVGTGGEGAAGVTGAAGVGTGAPPATVGGTRPEALPGALADAAAVTGTLPGGLEPGRAIGADVRGPVGGDEAAEIEDVLVDAGGKVAGVILDVGGLLGVGGRRVAVPLAMLRPGAPDGDRPGLALAVGEDELGRLPEYEREGDGWVRRAPRQ